MTQTLPGAVCLMAAGLALGGCGGGGGSSTGDVRAAVVATVRLADKATCTNGFTDSGIKAYYREDTAAAGRRDCAGEVGRAVNLQRTKNLKVSGIAVNGDSATARAQLNGRSAVYSLVKQGGWKVSGIRAAGDSASASTTASSATTASTTASTTATATTSSSGPNTDRLALEIAARKYNVESGRFGSRVKADAEAKSLDAVKGDAAQFRDAVFAFDTTVRTIKPATAASEPYNALLATDRTTIADLDAIGSAPTAAEVGRLFRSRLVPDTRALIAAEARLYDAL